MISAEYANGHAAPLPALLSQIGKNAVIVCFRDVGSPEFGKDS
jgi:hypothetical protein